MILEMYVMQSSYPFLLLLRNYFREIEIEDGSPMECVI